MSEIWKPISGYEGLYEVSNLGNVRSLFRYKKVLKWNVSGNGYATVQLFKDKIGKRLLVHRLVASAFIRLPDMNEQVNHIDENKLNNTVTNLEWVTAAENMNYGTRRKRQIANTDYTSLQRKIIAIENGKKACKPVIQFDLNNNFVCKYESGKSAHLQTGVNHSHIMECCSGKYKTAGGYKWRYENG